MSEFAQSLNELLITLYRGERIVQQDKNTYRVKFFSFPSLEKAKEFIDTFLNKDDNQK